MFCCLHVTLLVSFESFTEVAGTANIQFTIFVAIQDIDRPSHVLGELRFELSIVFSMFSQLPVLRLVSSKLRVCHTFSFRGR